MNFIIINLNKLAISILSVITLSICSPTVFAQLISSDQAPPSVVWRQLDQPHFRLIFPSELEEEGKKLATTLNKAITLLSERTGIKPRKIDILLQNRTVESNGYVQLAPRKSEFYTTPPQDSEPSDWLKNLAIHEYKHVVQIDKLTGNIKFPFEELGFAFFGIALPPWFYEGDAVLAETLYSKGGRGRLPSWEMKLRANILEGKNYSYQKNYLGSLKSVTPGYYELGYFLTTKFTKDFGTHSVNHLLSRIAANPLRPYNFSSTLKEITGYSTEGWHDHTMTDLRTIWEDQLNQTNAAAYPTIPSPPSKFPMVLSHPQIHNGKIITLVEDRQKVNSIIEIDSLGQFQEIIKTGRQNMLHFSYANNKLTWDEIQADGRFKLRSYSVLHVYDLQKNKHKQLTKKSRLFSPALNPQATKIAAVETTLSNHHFLVILDAVTGAEIQRIPSPNNNALSSLFYGENEKVLAVTKSSEGSSIVEFRLEENLPVQLINKQIQEIESPSYMEDQILFKAHYNGIDNLYTLHPKTNSIDQVTNVKYGAFDPFYDRAGKHIYFTNYDGTDLLISRLQAHQRSRKSITELDNNSTQYFKPLEASKVPPTVNTGWDSTSTTVEPYKEHKNLFNFHSLSINDGEYDNLQDYQPGLYILSNNLLNTFAAKAGVTYNPDEHGLNFKTELQYNRYFPKISLAYENNSLLNNIRHPKDSLLYAVRWRENVAQLQVELPYSFNKLNYNYSVRFNVASSYTHRYQISVPSFDPLFIKKFAFPISYQLSLGRNTRVSRLDLAPRWGQNLVLGFRNLPFSNLNGHRFYLQSRVYLPGLLLNHSTQLRFNYQYRKGFYANESIIPMVSGYDQLRPSRPDNTFFMNYTFPIVYPDLELGNLAYIKRIKANLFADFEDIAFNKAFRPRTLGVEFRADMNLLRFFLPNFDMGIKTIYINESNPKNFIFQYGLYYSY